MATLPGFKPPKGGLYSMKSVRPFRVETDPRVRDNAPCVVCKGERPPIAVAHRDPFCKRPCCETYYMGESVAAHRVTSEALS